MKSGFVGRSGRRRAALAPFALVAGALALPAGADAAERVLERGAWSLLVVPGEAQQRSVRELFADDLPASGYGTSWAIFSWDGAEGRYRSPALDAPLGTAAGFWMIQEVADRVTIDVPERAPAATVGPACASPGGCVRLPLATRSAASGLTLAGFPSPAGGKASTLRITASGGACRSGCDLDAAWADGLLEQPGWAWNDAMGTYTAIDMGSTVAPWQAFWVGTRPDTGGRAPALLVPAGGAPSAGGNLAARNAAGGRGINIGNALEAPYEGAWGVTIEPDTFATIAAAGFDSVRLPVRWSAWAQEAAPYTLDASMLARVDAALDEAGRAGLAAIVDVHHYDALQANPAAEADRFVAIWRQLGRHFASRPSNVAFELLNEPHGAFDADPAAWNALARRALAAVRGTNPERSVLIGPVGYNDIGRLDALVLPPDPNVIATVHYYSPFEFTHQGAEWLDPVPPLGARWSPNVARLGRGLRNWSWDTVVTPVNRALDVRFGRRYAGFVMHLDAARPVTQLRLDVAGTLNVDVLCRAGSSTFLAVGRIDASSATVASVTADLAACPRSTTDVVLQSSTDNAPAFRIAGGELCDAAACRAVLSTLGAEVDADIAVAVAWANRASVPLNIGEFGAYGTADLASRAAWTRRVQGAARAAGVSTHYWEYAGGFGAWNPDTGTWRTPLLDALMQR